MLMVFFSSRSDSKRSCLGRRVGKEHDPSCLFFKVLDETFEGRRIACSMTGKLRILIVIFSNLIDVIKNIKEFFFFLVWIKEHLLIAEWTTQVNVSVFYCISFGGFLSKVFTSLKFEVRCPFCIEVNHS